MKTPFMDERGEIKFPTDSEESDNGTSDNLHTERDSADPVGAGLDNFDLLSPIAQLETLAKTL